MKLYDGGRLSLTDRVSTYLPFLQDTDKKNITVRELLMHESGLHSTLLFYQEAIDEESYTCLLYTSKQLEKVEATFASTLNLRQIIY